VEAVGTKLIDWVKGEKEMNHLRRDCYERCGRKMRKNAGGRIANISATMTRSLSGSSTRAFGRLNPSFRRYSNHRLNPLPSELSPKRNSIGTICSRIHLDCARSVNQRRGISTDATGFSMLEEAAFASKEIVERRLIKSVETAVWKSSTQTERKRMYRFFFPQLRKATNDLLVATRDVELLSDLITKACENKSCKTAADISLRGLHSSFLQLTQIVLDNFDVAMESERDQNEVGHDSSSHSLRMLELVLSLSDRANMLGLGYHWPLYQRLALAVAKHPKTIDEITSSATSETLGSLLSHSRAEWIQTILRWSQLTWSNGDNDGQNQESDDDSELTLKRKQDDLKWFHPSLKVLAEDGHWSDVNQILVGVLQPDLESTVASDDYDNISVADKADRCTDFEDSFVLSSAISVPYLDEEIVFDLLIPMERQGLLRDLWKKRRLYPHSDSVVENIIFMMEVSIWKIFYTIPSHMKGTTRDEDIDYSVTYGLRDAIGILLKCGPTNLSESRSLYDDEREYLSDDEEEEDSLVKALSELEDILDEHLDLGTDGEGAVDEINQTGSDAIALTTALANETGHEGTKDNQSSGSGHFNHVNLEDAVTASDKSEGSMGRSYGEHVMERTSLDTAPHYPTENILGNIEQEEYLDFIYDDREADYEDNIPDITKQIYQLNGNQQLRYSTALEYHIFEGLHRPNFHYEDEDDFEF